MKKHGIRARVRPALDYPGRGDYRKVFPFRRPWIAIGILLVVDAIFIIPAIGVFDQAVSGWSDFEDLFDVVAALFSSLWLLGWSIAPLIMTVVLLLMLLGRETVTLSGDSLRLFIGLPFIGIRADYQLSALRNLRREMPVKKSGKSWRGPHLQFDYGANHFAFGSNASEADRQALLRAIQRHSGQAVRSGEARPQELEGSWAPVEEKPVVPLVSEAVPAQAGPPPTPMKWSSPSSLALIIANLVPVAGTVFLGWNLGDVMVLYWAESAVVGFYNLGKMAVIGRWFAIFTGLFFIAHYGVFMAVHFLFIYGIFIEGFQQQSPDDLKDVAQMFGRLWPAVVALFVSHGISFFTNFIGRKEYEGLSAKDQMGEPYTRIILMHLVIIFGGGLALVLGDATPVLLLVIAGKIVFDVWAHIREHDDR